MFYVIDFKKEKQNIFKRIFNISSDDLCIINEVPVFKGAPFYKMKIMYENSEPNWKEIENQLSLYNKNIILTENAKEIVNGRFKSYKSDGLKRYLIENTFFQILKNNYKDLYNIFVVDRVGKINNFMYMIEPFVKNISVHTDNYEKYNTISEKIMAKSGLCILFCEANKNANVIVNFDEDIMTINIENRILSIKPTNEFDVPKMYEKILPENTLKYDFYNALYEMRGVFLLDSCYFSKIIVNDKKITTDDMRFT